MATTVVNVRTDAFDVYIGRANPSQRLPRSPFANPFKVGRDGTREEVIEKYRTYLLARPDLLAEIGSLKGKRLGCWCKPDACHGDILASLAEQRGGNQAA